MNTLMTTTDQAGPKRRRRAPAQKPMVLFSFYKERGRKTNTYLRPTTTRTAVTLIKRTGSLGGTDAYGGEQGP